MTDVRLRTVDSFTDKPFSGNPAAVLMLDQARSDDWMAAVARETNLSDTGFVIRESPSRAAMTAELIELVQQMRELTLRRDSYANRRVAAGVLS